MLSLRSAPKFRGTEIFSFFFGENTGGIKTLTGNFAFYCSALCSASASIETNHALQQSAFARHQHTT